MKHRAGKGLRAALFAAAMAATLVAAPASGAPHLPEGEARRLLEWVTAHRDHQGLPFAIVDKRQARLYVFDAQGRLAGSAPAVLGSAWGDHTVPGVGERTQQGMVPASERTTPAGRYVANPGRNRNGENVVWVDYTSAFAIHRLRPGRSHAVRDAALATDSARDNRLSWGCVVVAVPFYLDVVERVLGKGRSIVYVMPETRAVADMFAGA
jgi:hypothetical protein